MNLLQHMSVFISQPCLALVPGLGFVALGALVKSRFVQAVGAAWLVYCVLELGNKYRITCSGECNIRVDLLLIYPVLALGSLAGCIVALGKLVKRSRA